MLSRVITLTTDFGCGSPYVAAIKGVILSIHPAAVMVDVTHGIAPQNIRQAALVLDEVTPRFPPHTVHVCVVDPGVGTERAVIYARIGNQCYVAPDNGVLSKLAEREAPSQIVSITDPQYWLTPLSDTFHGRDLMAPVAARLSLGLEPALLGEPRRSLIRLSWPQVETAPGQIAGEVLLVDSFGNLITNIARPHLEAVPPDEPVAVYCGEVRINGILRTYGERPAGHVVALVGSSGQLELAIVGGSAARELGLGAGTPVRVCW